ncbi:MAG: DUF3883 domain-containing protein [Granulosicoccus sp.]
MTDWTPHEVHETVSAYLQMLTLELSGQSYNKAAINRELIEKLDDRSKAAIEFKHGNISAALVELGFPVVQGYKPRRNFQRRALFESLIKQISERHLLDDAAVKAVELPATAPVISEFDKVITPAPRPEASNTGDYKPPYLAKRDYMAIEARNRSLGLAGEKFILAYEIWRLRQHGVNKLADKVEHISVTRGDGAGYDILSFEDSGRPRYIEVKTTAYSERTPFWISANELRFADNNDVEFRLARVFDFRKSPKFFTLAGPVGRHCELDPTTFRASIR